MKSSLLLEVLATFILTFNFATTSDLETKVAQLKQQVDDHIATHLENNRDVHTWMQNFSELKAEMEELMTEENLCKQRDLLKQKIDALNTLLGEIQIAWESKEEQIGGLETILHHEKYNTTGLANASGDVCESLKTFLIEAKEKHSEEGRKIKEYENFVKTSFEKWNTHPCDCVWGPWQEWTGCSKTCGEGQNVGKTNRQRIVDSPAINNGQACEGPESATESCNEKCCPENCTWNDWSDWTNCPAECVPGGTHQTRYRSKNEHKCGGTACQGLSTETNKCNPFLNQQEKCNVEITQKEHKIDQLEDRIAILEKDLGLCEIKPFWDIKQCYNSNLSDDKKTLLLDSRGKWPADHFCRAVNKDMKIDNGNSYEMTVEFDNLTPTNYGHVGFVYNVKDDKNYEYVFKRVHGVHSGNSFAYGVIKDGQFANGGPNYIDVGHAGPNIYGGKFYQLKIQVSADKKVKLFMDGKQLGGYNAFSPTWGHGGVAIANGFKNTAKFRNFQLIPMASTNRDMWDIKQCYNSNLGDDTKTLLLDSRGKWPDDHFCRAVNKVMKIDYGNSYEMTMEFENVTPKHNAGHVGFAFNVKDDNNYEYVYKRVHDTDYGYGAIENGKFANGKHGLFGTFVKHGGPKIFSGKFYTLKLQVSANKKFKVFMDGKQLGGEQNASFPTWGHGGVTIMNGFKNTAKFRNFKLTPM